MHALCLSATHMTTETTLHRLAIYFQYANHKKSRSAEPGLFCMFDMFFFHSPLTSRLYTP